MTINFSRAEGSDCRRAKGSCICNAINTKCVNCQSYNAKTACFGFRSGTKACEHSTGGGKNFPLCHQLEDNNQGPMGPSYGAGLPHSFQGGTLPSARSSTMPVFRGSDKALARGGIFLAGEGSSGDSGACCLGRRVLLDPLPGAQDRRSDEARHKPKSAELLGSSPALQDGGYPYVTGNSSTRRMACQVGSEGCLLHSTNPSGSLEVPSLHGRPSSLPIHMSAVQSILCSLGFYQGAKASFCFPEKCRSSPYRLYRRYPSDREDPGRSSESRGGLDRSIRGSGFHSQCGKVCVDSFPANRIPGVTVEYSQYVPDSSWSQDQGDLRRSCSASPPGQIQRAQAGTVYRETECCVPGSISSPAVLSPPSEGPTRSPSQGRSELRHNSSVVSGVPGGGSMVAGAPEPMEWSNLVEPSATVGDSVGRFHDGLGSRVRGNSDRWSVVPSGANAAHQLSGIDSSNTGCASLRQGSFGDIDPPAAGQSDGCSLYQPPGGTVSLQLVQLAETLWLWALQRDITLLAQHIPGVTNQVADEESRTTTDRLDWKLSLEVIQKINAIWGPLEVDLFASRLSSQLTRFFSWRPDPQAEVTDAFLQDWRHLKAYANPPWCLVGRVLRQVKAQRAQVILVAPVWKGQPWYPVLLEMLWDFPRWVPLCQDLFLMTSETVAMSYQPQLAVWPISGENLPVKTFQAKLGISSWLPGEQSPTRLTIPISKNGYAGALQGVQIPFLDL